MRRRKRNKTIIFILILFISIGFAALTANLSINSGITFLPQSFHIYFDNVVVNQNSVNKDLPTISNNDQQVSFTTTINEPGDFYEFSFDVINDGTMDAALTEIIKTGLTETQEKYLNYTARYYGERDIKVDDILHAGYKEKVIVRVEYKYDIDEVVSLGNITFNFGLNYIKRDLQKDYGEETWNIDNLDSENIFTVPKSGIYKLEVWGAQGRTNLYSTVVRTGGYGGYSTGIISLLSKTNINITIGKTHTKNDTTSIDGYGQGQLRGGGATHIALTQGKLSELENNQSKIIVVAGGGGGNDTCNSIIPSGGGYIGNSGRTSNFDSGVVVLGGTQTARENITDNSGTFGQGGQSLIVSNDSGGGGGGGYYGGDGSSSAAGCGGGGSGYIGNTNLTNKIMYCYNCQESTGETDETHIKTRSTTNVNSEPISYYAKQGNGFARITYLGKYNTNQYTVINYHPNGGQGSMETQVINSTTALKENKYTREGYTFVGWSTTEKELPNLIDNISNVTAFKETAPGEYTFDYNQYQGDTYFRINYVNNLPTNSDFSLVFNLKNFQDNKVVRYGYPNENANITRIKNGYNIIRFNTEDTTPSSGTFDDKADEKDLTASGTFYNFFLYKDSEVNYLDKSNITYSSNTKTINLYALWAKVES